MKFFNKEPKGVSSVEDHLDIKESLEKESSPTDFLKKLQELVKIISENLSQEPTKDKQKLAKAQLEALTLKIESRVKETTQEHVRSNLQKELVTLSRELEVETENAFLHSQDSTEIDNNNKLMKDLEEILTKEKFIVESKELQDLDKQITEEQDPKKKRRLQVRKKLNLQRKLELVLDQKLYENSQDIIEKFKKVSDPKDQEILNKEIEKIEQIKALQKKMEENSDKILQKYLQKIEEELKDQLSKLPKSAQKSEREKIEKEIEKNNEKKKLKETIEDTTISFFDEAGFSIALIQNIIDTRIHKSKKKKSK